jgi:hypothetical protein
MDFRNIFGVLMVSAVLCQAGRAQEPGSQAPQNPPADTGQAPVDSQADTSQRAVPAPALTGGLLSGGEAGSPGAWIAQGPVVPAIVAGYGNSLAFSTEMSRSNYIRGGGAAQFAYTDNASLSPVGVGSNVTLSLFPQIALDQSRSRIHWLLNYAGGYTYNNNLKPQNSTSQDLGLDVQYRVSPHVNVRVSEVVGYVSGIFGPTVNYYGTAPGIPQGNNPYVVTPLSTHFDNVSRGEIGYQFSGSSAVGASGGYTTSRFSNLAPGTVLLNTEMEDAAGFYMHRIHPGNWLGVSYLFQHLTYPPSASETFIHSPLVFDTITLREHMSLSFFAGPQYYEDTAPVSLGSSTLVSENKWTGAGGASFGWQGSQTSAYISVVRRLIDGGGLLGTSEVTSADGGLRRQFTQVWSGELGGSYALSDALNPGVTNTSRIRSAVIALNVQRQFSERLFLRFGYAHQFQNTTSTVLPTGDANRNQFVVTLAYIFARPWGR